MVFAAALALTAALLHVFNHSLFKSLLFFGAGAVLTATGERDMEHLGGLIHRMPQTAFVFLIGCVAISALPPLNGFVSEWLTFQAILLSPQLPSWGLKLLVPAVGALLALSAALAAACFVKVYGVTFLGRPRTPAAEGATETDSFRSLRCCFLALLCLLAGILPGLFIDALAPVSSALIGAHMPVQSGAQWLSIVPIAASRSSYDGLLVFPVHDHIGHARGIRDPPLRLEPTAPRAGLGLRLSRRQPGDAIHGDELCAADPARVRHRRVSRPRARLHAAARRHAAGAADGGIARSHLGNALCADRRRHRLCRRSSQSSAVPDHPPIPQPGVRRPRHPAPGARHMALILDVAVQGAQMLLVLLLAPLFTGFVRKVKARLLRRQGPPLIQPYRDLARLMRKDVVLAESASWLFRVIPYLIFAATWVAASLVPTFRTGLLFSWSADLIAIIALLGSGRFFLALAGLDVGTSFGGIGSSREVMIASLAEPAMIMIVFTLALIAGSTQLSTMAAFMASSEVGLRVSLGLALIALIMVAIAENGRIPVDNPATHLELTMVHEAMVLEYSGRHLALIELSASLKLILYVSVIACLFAPWGLASAAPEAGARRRGCRLCRKARRRRLSARAVRDVDRQDARVPRAGISGRGADAWPAGDTAAVRVGELLMSGSISTSPICSPARWC
jgi:formate hydrogenlyase subunit 4